jgi:DNA-binding MarR family transcriptional regulator
VTAAPSPLSITASLHRFGLERDRLRNALCRAAGMTTSELDALEHLELDGPLTQRELGQRLALSSGGVTVLVDRLERREWVARTAHPSDRRAVLLELNPRVFSQLPEVLASHHARITAAAQAIPVQHRAAVATFIAAASASAHRSAEELEALKAGR